MHRAETETMAASMNRGRAIKIVAIAVVAVSAVIVGGWRAERFFSSTDFCISCHVMRYPFEEMKRSLHYAASGGIPECGDCHLPRDPVDRTITHAAKGIKDLYGVFTKDISSQEGFSRYRDELADSAAADLRRWDGGPCRGCHGVPVPSSAPGRAAHMKLQRGEATCIDCHRGIFHAAPGT